MVLIRLSDHLSVISYAPVPFLNPFGQLPTSQVSKIILL